MENSSTSVPPCYVPVNKCDTCDKRDTCKNRNCYSPYIPYYPSYPVYPIWYVDPNNLPTITCKV